MAKYEAEKYFSIDPDIIDETRAPTFDLFICMSLNIRVAYFSPRGEVVPRAKIEALKAKGLKAFHVLAEQRGAYEEYISKKRTNSEDTKALTAERHEGKQTPFNANISADQLDARPGYNVHGSNNIDAPGSYGTGPGGTASPSKPNEPKAPLPTPETKPNAQDEARTFNNEVSAEDLMKGLLSDETSDQFAAKQESKKMLQKILQGPPKVDPTTEQIFNNPQTEHATNVAIYSVLLSIGLGQKNQMTLQDVIISALLHDIGATQIPIELLAIPSGKRSASQNKQFEDHVMLGVSLLDELDYHPNPRIVKMMSQHHEKFNGKGYPAHLESFNIDDLAQVIAFADLLDTIGDGRYDEVKRSLGDSLKVMSEIEKHSTFPQHFNPELFKKLMRWLKEASGKEYMKEAVTAVEQTKQKLSKAG